MQKKTLTLQINIWQNVNTGSIHIASKPRAFITTVNNKEGSKRGHHHLYNKLKTLLEEQGKWSEIVENSKN